MKCPHCGYDKIQPNFNFCPKCKSSLKELPKSNNVVENKSSTPQEKGVLNRVFSGWTYERAVADPFAFANWAQRHPNDTRVFLDKWKNEGRDITIIQRAISEANRARIENPTADNVDIDANIIYSNRETSRSRANNDFVETVNAAYTSDAAAIVRNKAIWKLQPGELARHIAPDEWVYVSEHLEGLVIEEGTSAIIYVDGEEVAHMGSGMYVFDDKHAAAAEVEAAIRQQEGGRKPDQQGFVTRIMDRIYRFFSGHKQDESAMQREERRRRFQQILGRLKKDTIIDVYLKSDRIFPAIFGHQHYSEVPEEGYKPYVIQTRYLDLAVGVSAQMQISDFKVFITNYLAGRKTVSIADVVKSADGAVVSILRYRLRDIEVTERGLDEVTFNVIKKHLMLNLPNMLHGVTLVDVLDIATSNATLERFRQVEETLYCTERDYDFLIRTNEFRNRIASEENDQRIREARSDQELRFCLDEVNKDDLLHKDELDQFESLLKNQKKIRDASNDADLDKAKWEIERNRLVSKEEFDIFNNDLNNREFDRDQVSEQMRARSLMATSLQKIQIDKDLVVAKIHADDEIIDELWERKRKEKGREAENWDLDAVIYGRKYVLERQQLIDEIEKRRINNEIAAEQIKGKQQQDEYEYGKKLKDHEVSQKIKDDEYESELRKQENALKNLQKLIDIEQNSLDQNQRRELEKQRETLMMQMNSLKVSHELQMNAKKEDHSYELEKERIKAETERAKIDTEVKMSADQLMSRNIAEMDATAQAVFAQSFSHLNDLELTKENAAERERLYKQMLDMSATNTEVLNKVHSDNSSSQVDIMKKMMDTFKDMNMAQTASQNSHVGSMLGAMQDFANTRINDAKDIKEEYRTQMHHEQERVDKNQDQSLNYTTRVKVSENTPNFVGGTSVNVRVATNVCPGCGQRIDDDDILCCPICGKDIK